MAQLVLGVAGAAIGSAFGMPQLGWTIGVALGGALAASQQKITGPRLSDLKVTGADYGASIPWVAGTPRVAGQIWWASDRREIASSESAGKGGGPTVTNFTYEIDCLIGLTDCEIGWVSRVWWNGKLVYNVIENSGGGSIDASLTTNYWRSLRVLTGNETQLPDATYEAAVGMDQAPAYRGRGAVLIEGMQLGNSGQLPNLTFEVAINGAQQGKVVLLMQFDGDLQDETGHAFLSDGTVAFGEGIFNVALDVGGTPTSGGGGNVVYSTGTSSDWDLNGGDFTMEGWMLFKGVPNRPRTLLHIEDAAGKYEYLIVNDGGAHVFYGFYPTGPTTMGTIGGSVPVNSGNLDTWFHLAFTRQGNNYYFFVNGVKVGPGPVAYRRAAGVKRIFIGNSSRGFIDGHYGMIDGLRIVSGKALYTADFAVPTSPPGFTTTLASMTPLPTLQQTVQALCERAGLPVGMFDASALSSITKPVRAMAASQVGSTRQVLEQLQTAYFFDAALSDKLYFRPRAGAPVSTIPFADLAAGVDDAAAEPLELVIASDLEISSQVAVKYANVNADQQPGTEYSDRVLSDQASLSTIELALGFTPAEAKGIADAIVADSVASLVSTSIRLPLKYARLEATDVVLVIDEDGSSIYRLRFNRKTDDLGVLGFEAVIDDAEVVTSAAVTDNADTSSSIVRALADTLLYPLDIPLLRDADDAPGYYVAARGTTSRWPGAVVLSSSNGVDYTSVATVNESAVMGQCTTTLGAWAGGGVMDEINTVTVSLEEGELASTTRDTLLASDTNTMLIGDEVVRFLTATLLSSEPNVYKLTRLLRGQRGTEWAMAGHAASERAVLLQPRGLRRVVQQAGEIGQARQLKGVTNGTSAADVSPLVFTPVSVSQRPFAPVDLRVAVDSGTADAVLTWRRRSRLSIRFASPLGINVPLGETIERYDVEIWSSGFTALKRTFAAVPEPQARYTFAQQHADFGTAQTVLNVRVYQLSSAGGRGYALQLTVNVPANAGTLSPILFAASAAGWLAQTSRYDNSGAPGVANDVRTTSFWKSAAPGGSYTLIRAVSSSTERPDLLADFVPIFGRIAQSNSYVLGLQFDTSGGSAPKFTRAPLDLSADPSLVATSITFAAPRILCGDGARFLLFGENSKVFESTNGQAWTLVGDMAGATFPHQIGSSAYTSNMVTKIGSRFFLTFGVAGGLSVSDRLFYSDDSDALTGWTAATGISVGSNESLHEEIAYDGSRHYAAVTKLSAGTCDIYSSADGGATWAFEFTATPTTGFEVNTSGTDAADAQQFQVTGTTGADYVRLYLINGVVFEKLVGTTSWTGKSSMLVNPSFGAVYVGTMAITDYAPLYSPTGSYIKSETSGVFTLATGF